MFWKCGVCGAQQPIIILTPKIKRMKIFLTQFFELFNRKLLRLSLIIAFLFSLSLTTIEANSFLNCTSTLENETTKMIVIPDSENAEKAIIQLFAATTEANIIIFNSLGTVVFEESFPVEKESKNTLNLDLSFLGSGTFYIVHDESKDSATYSIK